MWSDAEDLTLEWIETYEKIYKSKEKLPDKVWIGYDKLYKKHSVMIK